MTAGVVLAAPIWFYQLWRFITPALHRNERRYAFSFVATASFLFVTSRAGLSRRRQGLPLPAQRRQRGADHHAGRQQVLRVHPQPPDHLRDQLRIADPVDRTQYDRRPRLPAPQAMAAADRYVPICRGRDAGQDPFTMLALALSLTVLLELSIQVARVNDGRKARKRSAIEYLSDDEAPDPRRRAPGRWPARFPPPRVPPDNRFATNRTSMTSQSMTTLADFTARLDFRLTTSSGGSEALRRRPRRAARPPEPGQTIVGESSRSTWPWPAAPNALHDADQGAEQPEVPRPGGDPRRGQR